MTFNARRPLMEDDLKIQNFEYLSSHWLDHPQIFNISSWDQTKFKNGLMKTTLIGGWPLMEDDLKLQKFEYLSSHWSDLLQILNISLWEQTKVKKGFNEEELQWKTTSKGRLPNNVTI